MKYTAASFYFQRLEALTANTSDGKPLKDFHREQYGGTIGGPIQERQGVFTSLRLKAFAKISTAPILASRLGTPCPISAPTIIANEALINGNADCQRLALINFFRNTRQPGRRTCRSNTRSITRHSSQSSIGTLNHRTNWRCRTTSTTRRIRIKRLTSRLTAIPQTASKVRRRSTSSTSTSSARFRRRSSTKLTSLIRAK